MKFLLTLLILLQATSLCMFARILKYVSTFCCLTFLASCGSKNSPSNSSTPPKPPAPERECTFKELKAADVVDVYIEMKNSFNSLDPLSPNREDNKAFYALSIQEAAQGILSQNKYEEFMRPKNFIYIFHDLETWAVFKIYDVSEKDQILAQLSNRKCFNQ